MSQGGSALRGCSRYICGGLVLVLAMLISGCAGLHLPVPHAPPVEVKTSAPVSPAPPVQTVKPVEAQMPVPTPVEPAPPVQIVKPVQAVEAVQAVQALKPIEPAPVVLVPAKEPEPLLALVSPPPPPPSPPPATVQGLHTPGSQAHSAREYRKDAAGHLYKKYADRIYAGILPAMLQAVAVIEVDINKQGAVTAFRWLRAPRHAPKIMTEIEGMVYASSPFPVPNRMGPVTYTETWLWHKSGHFQLDTLTQGQK